MSETSNLNLPYIAVSQAQKHVTHNEALTMLDAVVQLSVVDRGRTAAPDVPAEGDRHIVASAATGLWAGNDDRIAAWQDGGWRFFSPREGWLAWIEAEQAVLAFHGGEWISLTGADAEPSFATLGIHGAADLTNRLVIKAEAALFDHDGHDHRLKINKAAAADTGSIVLQSGYSGYAELGLAGDSDWHLKVSPDGSAWHEGMIVRNSSGRLELPENAAAKTRALVEGRLLVTGGTFDTGDGTPAGVAIGYDMSGDYGWVGAIQTGWAQKTLALQPLGAEITFGAPTSANVAAASGPGGYYHVSSANNVRIDVSATNTPGAGAIFARSAALSAAQPLSLSLYGGGVAVQQTAVTSGFVMDVNGAIRCTALTQTSDGNLKTVLGPALGLDFIRKLNPVTYRWKPTQARVEMANGIDGKPVEITVPGETPVRQHQGLIAQEVAAVCTQIGVEFGGYKNTAHNEPEREAVHMLDYAQFIAPLIRAVQELAELIDTPD
jgi:hypothetical protein